MLKFGRQDAVAVFALGKSSPKRNRLDQCLLGLEESQKWMFFEGVIWLKALKLKALIVSYAASQALTPYLEAQNHMDCGLSCHKNFAGCRRKLG